VSSGELLAGQTAFVWSAAELSERLGGVDTDAWNRFASHWEHLAPDRYAAELGTTRLRRYGHFVYTAPDDSIRLLPHQAFIQPQESNPLYVQRNRHFEPLTDVFAAEPLLRSLLVLLGRVATTLEDATEWDAKVTPFRVLASAERPGDPNPEGPHHDGVSLVTALLVGRDNATGGESTVYDLDRTPMLTTTLCEPGAMLVGDDRRTLHGVSPIRPIDPSRPARRDVLVITFAPSRR
jgi:hypothetical protein